MPVVVVPVPLRLIAPEPGRRTREPVTVGLPWPRGLVADDRLFRLTIPAGPTTPLQTQVLARWPDGSVKWCLFDFLADVPDAAQPAAGYALTLADTPRPPDPPFAPALPVFRLTINGEIVPLKSPSMPPAGPVRARHQIHGEGPNGLRVSGHIDTFANLTATRFQLTLTNPNPADHPGGNWDLGNGGSIDIDELALEWDLTDTATPAAEISLELNTPAQSTTLPIVLHQESSGGENWQSDAHLDRTGQVRLAYRGYKLTTPTGEQPGRRATPAVSVGGMGLAVPAFWQNFPQAIHISPGTLRLVLLPRCPDRPHELQGGEQKTWQFVVDYAATAPPTWGRSPLVASAPPEWYAATGVIPHLTPEATDPHPDMLALARQALEGPDTLETKRETIDEYGWRNYGDIYGDHEAVFHKVPAPLISHYNNQYDCVLALLTYYFRTRNPILLDQGLACALHTVDIDIYHTAGDKPAYNGGLFWHTYHYAAAGTGTHRSYPKALRGVSHFDAGQDLAAMGETGAKLKKVYAVGGGPAGSHNYNAGLALAYHLTGNELFREAAVGLADFVLSMDAPRGGVFRLLSGQYSGLATESSAGYHGPGRASANSVLALLTGYELTGRPEYLAYAEKLIRRVAHPEQALNQLDLLNAELRWFYTMFLQALGVYLDTKIERNQLDENYAYAQAVLLHYARWMAVHELPILDNPERLQYPTETWVAQDLRKVEVFQFAANHTNSPVEKILFAEKAKYFHNYCGTTLSNFATKSLCRPVILVLRYGWSHTGWLMGATPAPAPTRVPATWGRWKRFVPQKERAIQRAKQLVMLAAFVGMIAGIALVVWLIR